MRQQLQRAIELFATALMLFGPIAVQAGDWPGWRGPTRQGHSDERSLPLTWDGKTGENVRWKVLLHGGSKKNPETSSPGWSSPILWKDRVFLTTSVWREGLSEKERRATIPDHHVLCVQASDGKLLWDTLIPPGRCVVTDALRGYSVPTPVTDGTLVFALFGSGVIAAVDFDGKIAWREELPLSKEIDSGICSSPLLYGATVIFPAINQAGLRALDNRTGKLKWEQKASDHNRMSSPAMLSSAGHTQLVHFAGGIQSLDPETGTLNWFNRGLSTGLSSPVFGDNWIYVDSGRGGGTGSSVKAQGKGDVGKESLNWQTKTPGAGGSSAIVVGDFIYRSADPGRIVCRRVSTGELVYDERAANITPTASPISTPDGRLYFAGSTRSYVIKTGPDLEILASNDLGDGPDYSSPAASNGCLFIKGRSFLWCIGMKSED